MKNRPHDKKAGIAILVALIIISLADIIFRAATMGLEAMSTSNFGEQLIVVALAVAILLLNAKGKDRACYILFAAWIAYFVLDQLFEMPGLLTTLLTLFGETGGLHFARIGAIFVRILSMIGTVSIGILLAEYLSDGTINNRAFNIVSGLTVLFILPSIISPLIYVFSGSADSMYVLASFNALYRLAMVFMFTFFAYDSAKHQLKKTNLTK